MFNGARVLVAGGTGRLPNRQKYSAGKTTQSKNLIAIWAYVDDERRKRT